MPELNSSSEKNLNSDDKLPGSTFGPGTDDDGVDVTPVGEPLASEHGSDGETAGDMTVTELREWLRQWVSDTTGLPVDQVSDDRPLEEFGLSSRDAVAMSGDIEDKTGVILTATVAYQHPTIASLAKRIIEGDPDEGRDDDEDTARYQRVRGDDDDIA